MQLGHVCVGSSSQKNTLMGGVLRNKGGKPAQELAQEEVEKIHHALSKGRSGSLGRNNRALRRSTNMGGRRGKSYFNEEFEKGSASRLGLKNAGEGRTTHAVRV